MDFDKMLKNDMDTIAERIEAGLEKQEIEAKISTEVLESIVRKIVKEELSTTIKEFEKILEKNIEKHMRCSSQNTNVQTYESKSAYIPKIDVKPKVSYDIRREAQYSGEMTCGGWTFFANKKEGGHLWAVNDSGEEYCELYPKTISRVNKIEDGYVYFTDADYNHLRISISNGKVEKTRR